MLGRVFDVVGRASLTCGKVKVLGAELRPPAKLRVLASLARSTRGRTKGAENEART